MEDPTNLASIPTENVGNNSRPVRMRRMSGTVVRKVATRTFPCPNAAVINLVLPPSSHSVPSHSQSSPPSPLLLQDDDLPVAKRPRLRIVSTCDKISKGAVADEEHSDEISIADAATADCTVVVVPTHASLPNDVLDPIAVVSPVRQTKNKWTPEEDAMLTEAVQRHGRSWNKSTVSVKVDATVGSKQ
jgi:hypothetical protein